MEQACHIGGLVVLLRIVRIGVARRARNATVSSRHPGMPCMLTPAPHALSSACPPSGRLRHVVAHSHVVTQVFHMEVEGRLVGEHVSIVMMNVHAVGHLLDDNASVAVTSKPVQQGLLLPGTTCEAKRAFFNASSTSSTLEVRATTAGIRRWRRFPSTARAQRRRGREVQSGNGRGHARWRSRNTWGGRP